MNSAMSLLLLLGLAACMSASPPTTGAPPLDTTLPEPGEVSPRRTH